MIRFEKAVLVIHGFAGGTYDQEYLANFLELDKSLDVYSFTLPGHDVKSIENATCASWIKESEKMVKFLIEAGYKNIYIVGHSMGGVIACYLATRFKEIKRLVLAAPSFTHFASKEEGGILAAIGKSPDIVKEYSAEEFLTRMRKLPISAVSEFFKLVDKYRKTPLKISIPVLILHGTDDQIVPISSSCEVFEEFLTTKKIFIRVNGYHHDLFKDKKVDLICKEVRKFLLKNELFIRKDTKEL